MDSWIQIRSAGWDEEKQSSSVLLTRRPPAFHWRTLREEAGGVEGQQETVVGGMQREKIQNGPTGDKKLEDEGGAGVQH